MKTVNDEPEAMKEIHLIRKQLYEQIKDMTPDERIRYFNGAVEQYEQQKKSKSSV